MNIETKQITTLRITDVAGLYPVTVYLENYQPGMGKITIECWGKSWTASWGAMGGDRIEQFFCRCDEHYLAKNLSGVTSDIFDEDAAQDMVKKSILELRKSDEIPGWEARGALDALESYEHEHDYMTSDNEVIQQVIGSEPWNTDWPTKQNPDYAYLCLIINTVKKALYAEMDKDEVAV